jgi:hypothetical protein
MAQFEVGSLVSVETREGPGWKGGNGGVGKVRKVNVGEDGVVVSYDVKYLMNGSEKAVLPIYISVPGETVKREVQPPKQFVPEDFVANAAERALARSEVMKRREKKLKMKDHQAPKPDHNVKTKKNKPLKDNTNNTIEVSSLGLYERRKNSLYFNQSLIFYFGQLCHHYLRKKKKLL